MSRLSWLLPSCLLVACATSTAQYRISPDAKLLAGRTAWREAQRAEPRARVNVVLLVADDLGSSDVGALGHAGPGIATPNIDALAAQGVTFEQGYVTSPLCSPSRAALLTGRYQQRFGHEGQPHERYASNALEYFVFEHFIAGGEWQLERRVSPDPDDVQRQGLPVGELTLAELLRRYGYATGAFGKWHLGWNPDFQPTHRGFDEQYGFYEAYSLYAAPADRDDVVSVRHGDFSERFIWSKGRSGSAAMRKNEAVIDEPGYLTTRFADEAVSFIDRHRAEPFFLYVPFSAPHTPFQARKEDVARFAAEPDENRRVYLALVASLDDAVGRIVRALDERGLTDDTLVVFVSDNGGALYTHATSNAPFRGGKFTLFEGGVRVPFIARFPGRLPKGARYAEPVSTLDVVPTVAAAAGVALPDDRAFDGVDLVPFVRGEREAAPHRELFWRAEYVSAVRSGDYKLVRDRGGGHTVLFDLAKDPGESNDLASTEPQRVRELEGALDRFDAQCRPPLWPHVMEYKWRDERGVEWWYPL